MMTQGFQGRVWRLSAGLMLALLLTAGLLVGGVMGRSAGAAEATVLKSLQPQHPRIFIRAGDAQWLRQQIKADRRMAAWYERIKASAKRMEGEPPVEHVLIGPRLLDKSRTVLGRMWTLGMVYLVDGDKAAAERAKKELLHVAAFKDWNPSHFLDVAEMTCAFGIGYDWFYPELSPQERQTIRTAIVEHGLKEGLRQFERKAFWTRATHNWSQVCNGGLTVGALAIADQEPELAGEIVEKCHQSILTSMTAFAPDGGFPEGPGYWNYATIYTAYYLDALDSALGTDFGIDAMPGFRDAGMFRIYCSGPAGLSFNYADAGSKVGTAPQMFWMANTFGIPAYRDDELKVANKFSPAHLLWLHAQSWMKRMDDASAPAKVEDLPLDRCFKRVAVAFFRSSWDGRNALYVGIKGGNNRFNHSHLDLGSFVLDDQGERWAVDLGSDDYNLPAYFGNKRWTYYRLRAESHNTLLLDGENQRPSAAAPVTAFYSSPKRSHVVIDLSAAWKGKATRVMRGLAMLNRSSVLVQDEVEAKEPVEMRWSFMTPAQIVIDGQTATLKLNGRQMTVRIISPTSAKFEVLSATPPKPQHQQPNMHNLTIAAGKVTSERLVVLIGRDAKAEAPKITPLGEWENDGQ